MKFVLFDLQLINLAAFDAVVGSFTVELQMVLHWIDKADSQPQLNASCTFLCDTTSAQPLCCDKIWVPPLRLPGCTINAIRSVTPTPYLEWQESNNLTVWRWFWYLNIDATCAAKPDFHNFPFDIQKLTIDVINPYASRTWFQLNKGFLEQNVGEGIAGIDLNPDRKTAGWDIKDLLVSSSCGTQESWLQTFRTQDYLLSMLSNQTKPYITQKQRIMDALNPDKNLQCAEMKSLEVPHEESLSNPADLLPYRTTFKDYGEKVNSTLQRYRDCVERLDYNFYLSTTASKITLPDLGSGEFDLSEENFNRSFGLLDISKEHPTKVSFPCAIAAMANLTTPGIRITILVQRFYKFYVVKLVLPTVACVAFTFSAVGLQPADLMGRLTVVVPSAIALTALQGFVVASDIPAVAYIAPTTYIVLISYLIQLLIAFESVIMSSCLKRRQNNPKYAWRRLNDANSVSDQQGKEIELTIPSEGQQDNTSMNSTTSNGLASEPTLHQTHSIDTSMIRKYDLAFMGVLAALYIVAVLVCIFVPWHRSHRMKSTLPEQYLSMWKN
eukprot:c24751_g2_i1 orf=230-1891(-)